MGILSLKTWEPAEFEGLTFEVKRCNPQESKLVARCYAAVTAGYQPIPADATSDQRAEFVMRRIEAAPEEMRDVFATLVRNVSGLEIDGQQATEGAQLYEVANASLILTVLSALVSHSGLSVAEGKGSASASGSYVAGAQLQTSPGSDATDIAVEVGPGPSGVTGASPLDGDFVTAEVG